MTGEHAHPEVLAVIVTFDPDLNALDTLVRNLLPQVASALIVDNGSAVDIAEWHRRGAYERLQLRLLGENRGIAAAQNVGIAHARDIGARHVLLSDQDSEPAADMVAQLLRALSRLTARGMQVAAVGPRFFDTNRDAFEPFIRPHGLRRHAVPCETADQTVEVDYVISSGCLIPIHVFAAVGGMTEAIFIDYVDVEWGLRARQRGYRSFSTCAATMRHRHGDRSLVVLGRRYSNHSPLRQYYRFRNAVWLYRQRHVPLLYKLGDAVRLVRKYFLYASFARPRLSYWRMMTLGLLDGVRSRLGRLDAPGGSAPERRRNS
jgi:rhamnosyltransferase